MVFSRRRAACASNRISLTWPGRGQQFGRACLFAVRYPHTTASPPARPNPRGSSHSKEPKPGRPRLTYLITADPTWSGWGRVWVTSVVQLLRKTAKYCVYKLPRTHRTWSATYQDGMARPCRRPPSFWPVSDGNWKIYRRAQIATVAQRCRICGLLLVLQRSSTGNIDLFLRDFLLPLC